MKNASSIVTVMFAVLAYVAGELSPATIREVIRRFHPAFSVTGNSTFDLQNLLDLTVQKKVNPGSYDSRDVNCIPDQRFSKMCSEGGECLSPRELVSAIRRPSRKEPLEVIFRELCPILLLQSHSCESFNNSLHQSLLSSSTASLPAAAKTKPEPFQVWLYGIISVTIISACSLTGLAIVPLLTRQLFHAMMNIFQGLAVGSLCGSAIFHLIPQAFDLTQQDGYLWKSLVVFGGIYFFYISERIMKLIGSLKKEEKKKINLNPITEEAGQLVDGNHGHPHGVSKDGSIASVAWLIIFGDGMHNFIDGLSLGAAFNTSILGGISISVAVICEEFPHELGDFAVLLGAGMSARQAVLYNFLSALTCFLGLAVGILVGDLTQGAPAVFAFAAGMFLYISLVGMMGEINESLEKVCGFLPQVRTLLLQNLGIVTGVVTMFVMAKFADVIDFETFSLTAEDRAAYSTSLEHINRNAKGMLGTGF
ncbi:zinc transporter ZIP8 [Galendromus occidentalis]|uniref:Zinc transporter ZIP8 n=1 Tax=Galendromus occidentalis TaxID=34638 RepID=A0AAJ6QY90_9ACAR|nr:zinc transporter ZIP8 [Galendromus occidentalis]